MKKKLLSCAITITMVATMGTITAVSTSAEETKDTRGTIYFDSTDLYGATKDGVMYCYTWSDTEGGLFAWDTAGCKMTNIGDFLYSYDVPTKNSDGVAVEANLMIFHARGGKQTYDLTFDDSCMGDTAYVSDDYYGCFPINSEFCLPMCSWSRNSSKGGARVTIDSTGRIHGVSLTKNETPESVVDEFIADYKEGMEEGKAGYDNPELITEENRAKLIEKITSIVYNISDPIIPPAEEPTKEPTEAPTEVPTEISTEETTEAKTEAPTEETTEAKTEAPTEKPTSTSTTATTATSKATTAPTTATSTNTAKGTVNTAQTAPLTALALTFVASLAVVFGVNKKRNSHSF